MQKDRRSGPDSSPSSPRLRPLDHVIDRAEGVGDAEIASVADQLGMDLAELAIALGAAQRPLVDPLRLGELSRFPDRTLDRPGDEMLQAAEDRPA